MPFKKGDPRPPKGGRQKGTKNKISKGMTEDIKAAWDMLQGEPRKSIQEQAKADPKWFYEFVRPMLPRESFIKAEVSLGHMTPEQLKEELLATVRDNPGIAEILANLETDSED
jgi:hypothetical protein